MSSRIATAVSFAREPNKPALPCARPVTTAPMRSDMAAGQTPPEPA